MYWPGFHTFPKFAKARRSNLLKGEFRCLHLVLFEKRADMHGITFILFISRTFILPSAEICVQVAHAFCIALQPASVQQIPIPIYAPLQGQHQAQLSLGAGPAASQTQELFTSSLQPYRCAPFPAVFLLLLPSPPKLGWPCVKVLT